MLTAKQNRFVMEYPVDWNATKAAIRAGYSPDTAHSIGSENLSKPEIITAIEERKKDLAAAAAVSRELVLRYWLETATADPSELSRIVRVNCRHCWGIDFEAQWTPAEYRRALDQALSAKQPQPAPNLAGGIGFNGWKEPNPACPECHGLGEERLYVEDTRKVSPAARRLFSGIHQTKDGIKLLTKDQDKAAENLAKYFGMVKDVKELSGKDGAPIPLAVQHSVKDLTDEQLAQLAQAPQLST